MMEKDKKQRMSFSPTAVVAAVVAVLVLSFLWKAPRKISFRTPLSIGESASVVEDIRKIGELSTACYYEEMVVKDSRPATSGLLGLKPFVGNDEIVFIAKGSVRAGYDLSMMRSEDAFRRGDTLYLRLPPPKLTDVIMNPSDIEAFHESGHWSNEDTAPAKISARSRLIDHALDAGILEKAEKSARENIINVLGALGYRNVEFVDDKVSIRNSYTNNSTESLR